MPPTSAWKYINKGLLTILSVFVLATITSIVFLSYALLKLDSLNISSGKSINTALLIDELLINLDDAETGSRGFVITGDEAYLQPYTAAKMRLPTILQRLTSGSGLDLSRQQKKDIDMLTRQRLALLDQTVEARRSSGEDAARQIIADGAGARLMDQIRTQVTTITDANLAASTPRQRQSHLNLQRALWVAGALTLFVLGICLVLVWYFQYTVARERAVEGTKNEFLSLASHQLRTPATNVKQYVGLLLDGYLGDLTKKQRGALDIAYKNNESEIRIMNDLLDVAKLDLQRIQINAQRVNIVSIVKQVIREYANLLDSRGQTISLKAPDELMALVDRTYFKGVIEKLIDNAVKYSHDKTAIRVIVRADAANQLCEVIVRDRGLGIQKREVPKLFMKFSRLTNEFSANTEGSGLGLYWVKRVIALHNGDIRVASSEGRGSRFTIRVPLG